MGIKERRAKFQDKKSLAQKPGFKKKPGFKGKPKPQGKPPGNKKIDVAKKRTGKFNRNRKLPEPEVEVKPEAEAEIKEEPTEQIPVEETAQKETKLGKSFSVTLAGLSKIRQNEKAILKMLKSNNISATEIQTEDGIHLIYSQKKHALKVSTNQIIDII